MTLDAEPPLRNTISKFSTQMISRTSPIHKSAVKNAEERVKEMTNSHIAQAVESFKGTPRDLIVAARRNEFQSFITPDLSDKHESEIKNLMDTSYSQSQKWQDLMTKKQNSSTSNRFMTAGKEQSRLQKTTAFKSSMRSSDGFRSTNKSIMPFEF